MGDNQEKKVPVSSSNSSFNLNFSKPKSGHKKLRIFLIVFFILLAALAVFFILSSSGKINSSFSAVSTCGDGTVSGYCSVTSPYFCNETSLIQNATLCGCQRDYIYENGSCVFNYLSVCKSPLIDGNLTLCGCKANFDPENKSMSYQKDCSFYYVNSNKNVKINYSVYGKNSSFNFGINSEILSYLLSLPRAQYYSSNQIPQMADFVTPMIDNSIQTQALSSLAVQIENLYPNSKNMQARVAASIVQDIPYKESQFGSIDHFSLRLSRYPYQVLAQNQGSCQGKSELLAGLLKQMGFGVVLFYFKKEDHISVGVKCPLKYSYRGTGYCFIETTEPSPITYSSGEYLAVNGGVGKLESKPEIIMISQGLSLSNNLQDYSDATLLTNLMDKINRTGTLNPLQKSQLESLKKKYNLSLGQA